MWTLPQLVVVLAWISSVKCIPVSKFYPFGSHLDSSLPPSDDFSSDSIRLKVPIKFFRDTFDDLYVNTNGLVSFLTEIPIFYNLPFPLDYLVIAPLYSNVDTRSSGTVFFRETNDPSLLAISAERVAKYYPNLAAQYNPISLFIATWDKVGYFDKKDDKVNTFQVVISTDKEETFVELLYADGGVQWLQAMTRGVGLPDIRAQAGIMASDGRLTTLKGSGTDQAVNFDKWSNTDVPGLYMFRVGQINDKENVEPPQTTQSSEENSDEEPTTCSAGEKKCHGKAYCVDSDTGFCCICREGYYGNGRNCLEIGKPLRVSGKLLVALNGLPQRHLDLQAYVVTTDGRSYTAISKAPQSMGHEMQLLESLGSLIGWLFAQQVNNAKNGYEITGGVLNHTVQITFARTHSITIHQRYFGLDFFDQLKMEAEITGNLPVIHPDFNITLPDFSETFSKIAPGQYRSQSNHVFRFGRRDETHDFTKDQTIQFNEFCNNNDQEINSHRLKITKNFISYSPKEEILRFASTNKIVLQREGQDPCLQGLIKCVANSSCLEVDDSFKCVCNPGFHALYSDQDEFGCVDINECTEGTHSCHPYAICVNEIGSFTCHCKPGFEGNGHNCEALESPCERDPRLCDFPNAYCTVPGDYSSCTCLSGFQQVANPQVEAGWSCDDINECIIGDRSPCGDYADCTNTNGGFQCVCKPGFSGDGLICEEREETICGHTQCPENSMCEDDPQYGPRCVCHSGYIGAPPNCLPESYSACTSNDDCSSNARCIYNDTTADYNCACIKGYSGDGYECYKSPDHHEEPAQGAQYMEKTCQGNDCWCLPGYYEQDGYCVRDDSRYRGPSQHRPSGSCSSHNDCHQRAQCVYLRDTRQYQCQCVSGYEGDGYECAEMELSCAQADICGQHAECKYDPNSQKHICICNNGFLGDGISCYAAEECGDGLDSCGANAECVMNESGVNECVCVSGFVRTASRQCVHEQQCPLCHREAQCVYDQTTDRASCRCNQGYMGDGVYDCRPQVLGCNIRSDCSPYARCIYSYEDAQYRCQCIQGYQGDGYECHSIRTCHDDPELCSPNARCVNLGGGNFHCRCFEGYYGNGTVCKEVRRHEGEFLLLNQGRSTLQIPFFPTKSNPGRPIQVHSDQTAIGIAIDCIEGRVYWSDISNRAIRSSRYNGSDVQDFITTDISSPEGLAIDWINREIYWTDSGLDTISSANLDSKERKILITQGLVNPRGIAVHPLRRKVFWSDWNRKDPKIEWANLDGTNRATLLQGDKVKLPNSLAIDWVSDELCWADAGTTSIECLGISTRTQRTVVSECSYPFGLAITTEKYYWTDWISKKIETATKNGQRSEPIKLPLSGGDKLYGLVAVTPSCPATY